jgi:uncharacterized protein (DUF4415 family)
MIRNGRFRGNRLVGCGPDDSPKKIAISIRVDEDVLDYFKQSGAGYQKRSAAFLHAAAQGQKTRLKSSR